MLIRVFSFPKMNTSLFLTFVLLNSCSIFCITTEEMEIDPTLLSNISKINEEWDKYHRKILSINNTENWTDENQRDSLEDTLNSETFSIYIEIMKWFQLRHETSVINNDETIEFKVGLSLFEEEAIPDGLNSPKTKINADINFYVTFIQLNSSIPFDLVRFNGKLRRKFDCSDINLGYDIDLKANRKHKVQESSADCYLSIYGGNESDLTISHNIKLKLACTKNFTAFPFDTMECKYLIDFYAYYRLSHPVNYTLDQVLYPEIDINDYYLEDMKVEKDSYQLKISWTSRRKHGYYIYTIYLPISLLVFVCWMSFFLGNSYSDVQMRLGLVVTILLTLVTVIQGLNQLIPKSPQYKASDSWSITSIGFVIAAMLEIVVNRVLLWCENKNTETNNNPENKDSNEIIDDIVEENQGLVGEADNNSGMTDGNCIKKYGLRIEQSGHFAKRKTEMLRARKYGLCARMINICSATLFPLIYSHFAFTHIEKYCSFERLWDNKYFESVSDYSKSTILPVTDFFFDPTEHLMMDVL